MKTWFRFLACRISLSIPVNIIPFFHHSNIPWDVSVLSLINLDHGIYGHPAVCPVLWVFSRLQCRAFSLYMQALLVEAKPLELLFRGIIGPHFADQMLNHPSFDGVVMQW